MGHRRLVDEAFEGFVTLDGIAVRKPSEMKPPSQRPAGRRVRPFADTVSQNEADALRCYAAPATPHPPISCTPLR